MGLCFSLSSVRWSPYCPRNEAHGVAEVPANPKQIPASSSPRVLATGASPILRTRLLTFRVLTHRQAARCSFPRRAGFLLRADTPILGEVRRVCLRTWIWTARSPCNPRSCRSSPAFPLGRWHRAPLGCSRPCGSDLGLETFLPLSLASAGGPARCGAAGGGGGRGSPLGLPF